MSQSRVLVKANGDLVGEAGIRFKNQLREAVRSNQDEIIVDLTRPSAINGPSVAAILMARNSAQAAGKTLKVKLGHSDWTVFAQLAGLDGLLIDEPVRS